MLKGLQSTQLLNHFHSLGQLRIFENLEDAGQLSALPWLPRKARFSLQELQMRAQLQIVDVNPRLVHIRSSVASAGISSEFSHHNISKWAAKAMNRAHKFLTKEKVENKGVI